MEAIENAKCDFCESVITNPCDGVKKARVVEDVRIATGKHGDIACRKCVKSSKTFRKANLIPALRLAKETEVQVRGGNFNSAEYTIKELNGAARQVEHEIKSLFKAIEQSTKRLDELNKLIDSIQEPYAKWLFDSYPERRKRANYAISKLQIRLLVFHRDGNKCVKCQSVRKLSVDHIKPVALGGNDELENLQTLCKKCNSAKGAK